MAMPVTPSCWSGGWPSAILRGRRWFLQERQCVNRFDGVPPREGFRGDDSKAGPLRNMPEGFLGAEVSPRRILVVEAARIAVVVRVVQESPAARTEHPEDL